MKTFSCANREAEAHALGCALQGDEAAIFLATIPEHIFTGGKHRALHRAIKTTVARDEGTYIPALREALLQAGKWTDSENGTGELINHDYLFQLQENCGPPEGVKGYVRILGNAYRQRRILEQVRKIEGQAGQRFLTDEELDSLENQLQEDAFAISAGNHNKGGLRPVSAVMHEVMANIRARKEGKLSQYGIKTGFSKLDEYTTGLHSGELIIVAGRTSMGKTSFALAVSLNAVKQAPVAFFSLEMGSEQIGQRLLARETAINTRFLRSGQITNHDFGRVLEACGNLSECSLFIDDSPRISPVQIRFRVRQIGVKTKKQVGLVIADYLQFLSPGRQIDNREQQVASITRAMKQVAKDLNCPVILLSQLNREPEKRQDKRPIVADLRESGAIEQDADLILLLYQPGAYTHADKDRNKAEVIIAKQRNGPIGTIDLRWVPETATFWDA